MKTTPQDPPRTHPYEDSLSSNGDVSLVNHVRCALRANGENNNLNYDALIPSWDFQQEALQLKERRYLHDAGGSHPRSRAWLLGSGLIGLVAIRRRMKK